MQLGPLPGIDVGTSWLVLEDTGLVQGGGGSEGLEFGVLVVRF